MTGRNVWAWKISLSYNSKDFVLKRRGRIFEEIFFFFWISNSAAFTFWSSSLLIYSFTSTNSIAILSCFNQFITVTDSCRDEWNIQNGSSNVWAWKILLSYNIKYFVLKRRWRIFEEFLSFIFSESDIQNQPPLYLVFWTYSENMRICNFRNGVTLPYT